MSRRDFLGLAALSVPVLAGVAACSSSKPSQPAPALEAPRGGGGSTGTATYWFLSGQPQQGIREDSVKAFNASSSKGKISYTEFQNDAYKTKIKTAIGAGQAPTIIWGWGGGGLKSYVQANQVEDLTSWFDQNPDVKNRLFPSSFGAATINGKIYAMPVRSGAADHPLLQQEGARQGWCPAAAVLGRHPGHGAEDQRQGHRPVLARRPVPLDQHDVAGVSLRPHRRPRGLPGRVRRREERLVQPGRDSRADRVPEADQGEWLHQRLPSITADSNADQALLYTGKAAMMLHGSWTYGNMKSSGGDFVTGGHLGWMNFPPVDGGKGDPSDTVGNPGQYLSISSKASDAQKQVALDYFKNGVLADAEVKEWIKTGSVPIVKSASSQLSSAGDDAPFLKFVYDTSSQAKVFAQSWDQALSPTAAEVLLDNIAKLFALSISPQQYASNMNAVIGK